MSATRYVYAITRRDWEDNRDEYGSLELVEIHATLESANAAAKEHLREIANANDPVEDLEGDLEFEDNVFNGCYSGRYQHPVLGFTRSEVEVARRTLHCNDQRTKPKIKPGTRIPLGKPGALSGLKCESHDPLAVVQSC